MTRKLIDQRCFVLVVGDEGEIPRKSKKREIKIGKEIKRETRRGKKRGRRKQTHVIEGKEKTGRKRGKAHVALGDTIDRSALLVFA